jgi:glycosyltransferase involved in cell wall biosynthesis
VEVAEALGARLVVNEFPGDGPQRNVGAGHAEHDWVLVLDADERIDEEMCRAIRGLVLDDADVAYAFNRKSFVGRHWIDGPGFYPDVLTRLYNRTRSRYEDRYQHATVVAPRIERAPGHILHFTYDDLSNWIQSIDFGSSWAARQMYDSGRGPSAWAPALRALAAGVRQLILRGGVFRGVDGRTIAMTTMFNTYMKYLKLNEMHEKAADGDQESDGSRGGGGPA